MQVQSQTIFLRNNGVEMEEDLWPMVFPSFDFISTISHHIRQANLSGSHLARCDGWP